LKWRDGDDTATAELSDEEIEANLRKINAHLPHVVDPMNADYVNYFDIVALYSHSGKPGASQTRVT
jgi:hypothetical protein